MYTGNGFNPGKVSKEVRGKVEVREKRKTLRLLYST